MSNSFRPPRFPRSRNHDKFHRNIPKIGNRVRSHWRLVRSGLENDTSLTVCHIPRLDSSQARIEMPHYLGLRSRLFGIHDLVSHLRRYGLQALVVPPQQSANEPTGGIRAGSLSLGTPPPPRCWWFVVCGTLMRHPRKMVVRPSGRYEPSDVRAFRRFSRA